MNQPPAILAMLIARFEQNREVYKSQRYNEPQLRREFLDPFFEALAWDVYDCRTGPNPTDKPSAGRILYLTYQDHLTKWDKITSIFIFTKEALLLDKYVAEDRKPGRASDGEPTMNFGTNT